MHDIKSAWRFLRARRQWLAVLLVISVAGGAFAAVKILSNELVYPGVVNGQMVVEAEWLGPNNTALTWYTGVERNVSVNVNPEGFVGSAHVVYEVDAAGVTCANVSLLPIQGYGDSSTCTVGTNLLSFDANSKYFTGSLLVFWWFHMVFNNVFGSATVRVYVVQG